MNILFIKTTIGASDKPYFDAGIASISAVLKQNGHCTSFFQLESWEQFKYLSKRIETFKPDIIGYSATASTCRYIGKISMRLRKMNPLIFQVLGGVHITLFPNDFINLPAIDAICLGEGEYAMLELVTNIKNQKLRKANIPGFWIRSNGEIIKNKKRPPILNLDALPIPDREIFNAEGLLIRPTFDDDHVGLEYIFARGCPFQCTYCSNHALHTFYGAHYVRRRSPKASVAEILSTIQKYRADYLIFYDDIFTLDKLWLNEFLELYRKSINLPFICHIRVGSCSYQTLALLKKSGCFQVNAGLESGSKYIRENFLNRYMKNSQIISTFQDAKKLKLRTAAYVILGFPHETSKHFFETVNLVVAVKPDIVYPFIFYPYPGTKLYDLCVTEKLLNKAKHRTIVERVSSPLILPTFPAMDIQYYFENFFNICSLYEKEITKEINLFVRYRRMYLRLIISVPPSSKFFWITQTLYYFDPMILLRPFFRKLFTFYRMKN